MATVREGPQSVLLVVDVQVGVMREAWQAERVIGNLARVVERARAEAVPVIWVQHADDELAPGSAAWQWVPELVPAANEALVHKRFNSAFEQTALEDLLGQRGASHIVLAGAASNWCIRATAYAALERGYDLTLVADAHSTGDMVLPGGVTVQAAQVVHDLNTTLAWLSYPGRRNAAVAADAVAFGG
jgi:nicotinamidase-related amidase